MKEVKELSTVHIFINKECGNDSKQGIPSIILGDPMSSKDPLVVLSKGNMIKLLNSLPKYTTKDRIISFAGDLIETADSKTVIDPAEYIEILTNELAITSFLYDCLLLESTKDKDNDQPLLA